MWVLLQVLPEGFKELAPDPQEAEAAALKEEEEAAAFVSALPCSRCDCFNNWLFDCEVGVTFECVFSGCKTGSR